MSRFAPHMVPATIVVVLVSVLTAAAQWETARVRALVVDDARFGPGWRAALARDARRGRSPGRRGFELRGSVEGAVPDTAPYDLILVVPRGLDRGEIHVVWVLSEAFVLTDGPTGEAVRAACLLVNQVFTGVASTVDVQQDLFPAFL